MLLPDVITVPAFDDNYLWLLAGDGVAVAVDPGDADAVQRALDAHGLRLAAILVTHHHPDHIGGIPELVARHGAGVYAPEDPRIPSATVRVEDGVRIPLPWPGVEAETLATPGHTRSHVSYRVGTRLFCGDTLFSLGCGRVFDGSATQLHASLARLATLPDDTAVHCAHEYTLANAAFAGVVDPDNAALAAFVARARARRAAGEPTVPSRLGDERDCNPFLRCDQPAIREAVARHTGVPPGDTAATFVALRAWKDAFRVAA